MQHFCIKIILCFSMFAFVLSGLSADTSSTNAEGQNTILKNSDFSTGNIEGWIFYKTDKKQELSIEKDDNQKNVVKLDNLSSKDCQLSSEPISYDNSKDYKLKFSYKGSALKASLQYWSGAKYIYSSLKELPATENWKETLIISEKVVKPGISDIKATFTIDQGACFIKDITLSAKDRADASVPSNVTSWIWYPEDPSVDCLKQKRYFRKNFQIKDKKIKKATLWIQGDDYFNACINGRKVSSTEGMPASWFEIKKSDVSDFIVIGKNIISVEVYNGGGEAGLISKLIIEYTDGDREETKTTDKAPGWKTAKSVSSGWEKADYDDSQWVDVKFAGFPWVGGKAKVTGYSELNDLAEKGKEPDLSFLDTEKPSSAEVKNYKGRPTFFLNGKAQYPLWYSTGQTFFHSPQGREEIEYTKSSGQNIYYLLFDLNKYWQETGEIDYTRFDKMMETVLSFNNKAHFIIGIRLFPPVWWLKKYPYELIAYDGVEPDFNVIGNQNNVPCNSVASSQWWEDADKIAVKLIKDIDSKKWGRRVVGYMLNELGSAEWNTFGTDYYPDKSKPMTLKFRDFVRKKYGVDISRLREAWHDPLITFESVEVPSGSERRIKDSYFLLDRIGDQKIVDWNMCYHDAVSEMAVHIAKVAKEASGGRCIIGEYIGAFFLCSLNESGKFSTRKLMECPDLDFLMCPYDYSRFSRAPGYGASIDRFVNLSGILNNKLIMTETDTRTYKSVASFKYENNLEESLNDIARDFGAALCQNIYNRYYDVSGQGWYADDKISELMKDLKKIGDLSLESAAPSAKVLLVVSESRYYVHSAQSLAGGKAYTGYIPNFIYILKNILPKCGVNFDAVFVSDLPKIKDISQYKVFLFSPCWYLSSEDRKFIDENLKKNGNILVWMNAPGFFNEKGADLKNICSLCGFNFRKDTNTYSGKLIVNNFSSRFTESLKKNEENKEYIMSLLPRILPLIYPEKDENSVVLGTIDGKFPGYVVREYDDWSSLYSVLPLGDTKILNAIFNVAGVHRFVNSDKMVCYANNHFVMLHAGENFEGEVYLPYKSFAVDLLDKILILEGAEAFRLKLPFGKTKLYYYTKDREDAVNIINKLK